MPITPGVAVTTFYATYGSKRALLFARLDAPTHRRTSLLFRMLFATWHRFLNERFIAEAHTDPKLGSEELPAIRTEFENKLISGLATSLPSDCRISFLPVSLMVSCSTPHPVVSERQINGRVGAAQSPVLSRDGMAIAFAPGTKNLDSLRKAGLAAARTTAKQAICYPEPLRTSQSNVAASIIGEV